MKGFTNITFPHLHTYKKSNSTQDKTLICRSLLENKKQRQTEAPHEVLSIYSKPSRKVKRNIEKIWQVVTFLAWIVSA